MVLRLDLVDDRLTLASEASKSAHLPNLTVNLSQFLRQTYQDRDHRMTLKHQKTLALSIASSVLQFWDTPWCSPSWNSEAIRLITETHAARYEPFVEQVADGNESVQKSKNHTHETKASVLELAILLLEICNLESLEMWAERKGHDLQQKVQFSDRLFLAITWLDETSDRDMTVYDKEAIKYCLSVCTWPGQSWQETEFRQGYYENIIKPLRENCKIW